MPLVLGVHLGDLRLFVHVLAATVASVGTFALAGSASVPDAPLGSDGSGTGTAVAPGAGVGIGTAFEASKLDDVVGAMRYVGDGRAIGKVVLGIGA